MKSAVLTGLVLGAALSGTRVLSHAWQQRSPAPDPFPGGIAGWVNLALLLGFVAHVFRGRVSELATLRRKTKVALGALVIGATVSGALSGIHVAAPLPSASALVVCSYFVAGMAEPLLVGGVLVALAYGRELPHALADEVKRG